ncbi:MAG: translocation/assembly module TamB, partial [Bdellovibrio sp.]
MKRAFWILLTPLAGFLVLWVIGSMLIAPRLETWALEKIRTYSATSLPVNIEAEKLELRFLKPSVALEKIRITGKGTLEPALKNIQIERVRVFVDFFHLLAGGLTLSAVVVESPDVALNIDPFMQDPSPPQELPLDELFSVLEKLPLQRIFLRNLHLQISSQDLKLQGELSGGDLLITNMGKNLTAKANLRSLQLQLDKVGSFQGSLDTHLYLTRQSLRIIQLGVRLAESEVLARGEFTPVSQLFIKPAGLLSVSARVKLDEFYREIQRTRPDLKIPPLAGELNIESEARFQGLQDLKAKAEIQTRSLIVEKIKLGDAKIQGEYSDRTVRLSEMQLSHPAGEASVTKAQITLAQDFAFKTQVTVHKLDLQQLFHSLNLHDIPAGLQAQGQWPCEGHIYPSFQLTCTGASLSAHDIWVKAGMRPRDTEILNVKDMSAQGQVQVTTEAVSYSADVTLGSSKGSSEGVIDFAKVFKIQFKTDRLDIKDITNLAHLKIEGQAGIEGSTSGDSHGAIFDMKLNARDFVFEDYTLGNLITLLKYRQGRLLFEDVAGAIKRTQYIGHLDVNLSQSTVQGEFSLPTAELNDVATAFSRVYKFPLTTQGTGSAKARVQGPLNFWKLNYQLQAAFKNGVIGPESFDTLDFNVSATDGNLKADKVRLQKGQASIVVNGGISSQQIMNLSADGKGWKLEESDLVGRANSNIIGNLSFSAEIKDSTKTPQVQIKGSVTDTLFEEQELPNSNFILQIQRESFSANLSLFGNKVQGEFQVPLGQSKTPLSIKMKTNNWGYSSLLGLIGGSNLANEYTSTLTSTVDLRSETGDPLKSTGKIMIQETSLKRGALQFANKAPIEIVAENGVVTIKDFQLEGPDNNLQIVGSRFTADNLNVAVSMRADLRLLHIFLPFLEDLGGSLNLSATVSGPLKKPEILGNLQSQNAYIKIKGFPHPLERLSTEVVFSQSRILINSVKAQIAGGTVNGDGGILINGIKDLPTSL